MANENALCAVECVPRNPISIVHTGHVGGLLDSKGVKRGKRTREKVEITDDGVSWYIPTRAPSQP